MPTALIYLASAQGAEPKQTLFTNVNVFGGVHEQRIENARVLVENTEKTMKYKPPASLTRRQASLGLVAGSLAFWKTNAARALSATVSENPLQRIAFGSCAQQWLPQPVWDAIAETDPDLFLFLGDAIYGDWDGETVFEPTPETLKRDWNRLAEVPEFSRFRKSVPILATWDNHDYGKHDGGAEFELKEESKRLFLDFFGEPAESARRRREGIYDSQVFGPLGKRVQIILLDTRTFKSPYIKDERSKEEKAALGIRGQYLPNTDPSATLLGAAQWRWLEAELTRDAELRLIASSTQVVADEKAMEEWGNFPLERLRLFDLIADVPGVLIVSGNVHFAELSRYDDGPYPIYDFSSSGLTHSTPPYAELRNQARIAGPFTEFNFGLVEIDWEAPTGPQIRLVAFGSDGQTAFETAFSVEELSP
ncbi:MAG: alkaline phosphatase family protein [bacterium]|nr:alkaline phosphatase family protein [bacterium]